LAAKWNFEMNNKPETAKSKLKILTKEFSKEQKKY
jgi:hypothetical protein